MCVGKKAWGEVRSQEAINDNGHLFCFCTKISGRHSSTCRDTMCWGFAREMIWDFVLTASVYIVALPPLGRGDDAEALL